MSLDGEILACEGSGCDAEIRFGDEVREAQLLGTLKGTGVAGTYAAGILGSLTANPAGYITLEAIGQAAKRLGYDAPSTTADTIDKTLVSAVNSELEALERDAYGWDWYVRMNGDGSIDGPYCGECR